MRPIRRTNQQETSRHFSAWKQEQGLEEVDLTWLEELPLRSRGSSEKRRAATVADAAAAVAAERRPSKKDEQFTLGFLAVVPGHSQRISPKVAPLRCLVSRAGLSFRAPGVERRIGELYYPSELADTPYRTPQKVRTRLVSRFRTFLHPCAGSCERDHGLPATGSLVAQRAAQAGGAGHGGAAPRRPKRCAEDLSPDG